jgi:hypothetical protein
MERIHYRDNVNFTKEHKSTPDVGWLLLWSNKAFSRLKAIPLQAWTGPEGSRRLKLPDFKTFGT